MAVVNDLERTYDQWNTNETWWAKQIHMLESAESDNKMQLMLMKVPVTSVDPTLPYDEFAITKSVLATSVNTTNVTLVITTGEAKIMLPGDVATYNCHLLVEEESMLATAISGTSTIIVTRGYHSTTKAAHALSARVDLLSVLKLEGADARQGKQVIRTSIVNYTQVFDEVVSVTGTQEAVMKRGGITSEIQYQLMKAGVQLQSKLEKTLLFADLAVKGASSASIRQASGFRGLITTNVATDSGSVDTTAIDADILKIYNAGGWPNFIMCDGKMAQDISKLYENRIQTDIFTTIGGHAVTAIVNPLSGQGLIAIIPHRQFRSGEYLMGDINKAAMGVLRPFFPKYEPVSGDKTTVALYGEYTLLIGLEKCFARRRGFS